MHLQSLQLANFKNYNEIRVDFSARINVLVGKNGSGKTNLLDAIHYLSLTRSAFSADNFCIKQGADFFFIKGQFNRKNDLVEISCSLQSGTKKSFKEGVNEYTRLSEHIGKYPVVLIAPDDTALVKEGSEERRKFFDSILSQIDKTYLESLIQYNHALKQRNGLLKMFAESNSFDALALEAYDRMLVQSGNSIYTRRKAFISEFLPFFTRFYNFIVNEEIADLEYRSELQKTDFASGLSVSRQRDLALQRTSFGIHRDDYQFMLGQGDLKRLGSQGQQKSFIIALKLAQFEVIRQHKNFKPILLLDDIFDKLDDHRISKLLELIEKNELGQIFITDARPERTTLLLRSIREQEAIFHVENGTLRNSDWEYP